MSNPMRGPSPTYVFSIPYSGTLANGDCVLFVTPTYVDVAAYYMNGVWKLLKAQSLEDTEHIIHIQTDYINSEAKAAFVPGPNH
nr:MAG TPA: hypothetical protein [Caudoviricetes sp.]